MMTTAYDGLVSLLVTFAI